MIQGIRRSLKGEKRASAESTKSNGATTGSSGSPLISNGNNNPSSVKPAGSFSTLATTPPKKIIKAIYDYSAQGPGELSFSKGDFLYVVGHENDEEWFEAFDPPSNLQGMVPVTYFEVVSRQETIPTVPIAEILNNVKKEHTVEAGSKSGSSTPHSGAVMSQSKTPPLYGVVLYNFVAERPDELQANAGESIIVIAQSNEEWFVAKPIGRLGGPGLIPVSYIQLREVGSDKPVTDIQAAVKRAGVPRVEEWKRMAAEYKASSITLGKFEDEASQAAKQMQAMSLREHPSSQQLKPASIHSNGGSSNHGAKSIRGVNGSVPQQQQQQQQQHQQPSHDQQQQQLAPPLSSQPLASPSGSSFAEANSYNGFSSASSSSYGHGSLAGSPGVPYVVHASVDRYAFHGGRYWYLLVCELSSGKHRKLCRYYQDFYDFQIKLLDEFPDEAGRTGKQRSLPFMPGPLTYVNDSISSQRRVNLDEYVRKLVQLPAFISRSPIVLQLFALRQGDVESSGQTNQMPTPADSASESVKGEETATSGPISSEGVHENIATPPAENYHSRMASQATVTDTAGLGSDTPNGSHSKSMVKIKVFHNDDLIAIRFPSNSDYAVLQQKICERLNLPRVKLVYKDDMTGNTHDMANDSDFSKALNGRSKLVLYAQTD